MSKTKVYLASGWFSPRTKEILDRLEMLLSAEETIELYSPRRDGIMLSPDQRDDTSLREKVFTDNIEHIKTADIVVANIDSMDPYNDPGTMYEIGYAMANHVKVIGFAENSENLYQRFKGIIEGFEFVVPYYEDLMQCINIIQGTPAETPDAVKKQKVLFLGAGNDEVDKKIASYIVDSGVNIRWVNEVHKEIYAKIDEIFTGVDYMIAVIDDRKTIVSWMIGQAYARGIPVVTYSDFNYGVNVMLTCSLKTHIMGAEELIVFLNKVKREGLTSIPKYDISKLNSY